MGSQSSASSRSEDYIKMQFSAAIALLGLAALAHAASIPVSSDSDWEQFKEIHGKVYRDHEEEIYRKSIFEENLEHIREHNEQFLSGLKTFSKSANQFADMHLHEIIRGGLKQEKKEHEDMYKPRDFTAPKSKDWRKEEGVVTGVKNQAQCGSCWAFSTTGSLEGQMMLKKNKKVSLSEQQLVDCSGDFGNYGCNGGLMGAAFEYIKSVGGIESEADYPYRARDMSCKANKSKFVATVTGYKRIESGSEEDLLKAVADVGPVSVAIEATFDFQLYSGGVLIDDTCSPRRLNHGVLAVGYGTTTGSKKLDYWIVKNSWGGSWGEKGYVKMARNHKNMCGIATQASFPTV